MYFYFLTTVGGANVFGCGKVNDKLLSSYLLSDVVCSHLLSALDMKALIQLHYIASVHRSVDVRKGKRGKERDNGGWQLCL